MEWDRRFINLAAYIAEWSKDPSTKCGAVIVDGKRIVSLGFNGFPQGVHDFDVRLHDRETKYKMVLHAEVNALLFASRDLKGCTIYVSPMPPCSRCAAQIIQSGIKKVVTMEPSGEQSARWGDDFLIAEKMYEEAGVEINFIPKDAVNE